MYGEKVHPSLHLQWKCNFPTLQWILFTVELVQFVTLLDFELFDKSHSNSKPQGPSSIHYKTRHKNELYQSAAPLHGSAEVFPIQL